MYNERNLSETVGFKFSLAQQSLMAQTRYNIKTAHKDISTYPHDMRPLAEREYFEESLLENDFLQDTQSLVEARRWVDKVVSESRPLEVLRYVELFIGKGPLRQRRKRKKGGAIEERCDDQHDPRIYRLLALADSVHDGLSQSFGQSPESIMGYMGLTANDLPNGLKPATLRTEAKVIDFLQRRKKLRFEKEDIANPCHGADLAHFDLQAARLVNPKPSVDVLTATYRQAAEAVKRMDLSASRRVLCVPVYSMLEMHNPRSSKLQRIQLAQLLDLAARIRTWFGERCVFQPDTYHPVLKFVTATKWINKAFYNKFVVEQDYHVVKYESEISRAIARAGVGTTAWEMVLCDANYYDGTSISDALPIDTAATGWVFRHGIIGIGPHNVRLEGISDDGKVKRVKYSEFLDNKLDSDEVERESTRSTLSTAALFSQLPGARRNRRGVLSNAEACQQLNMKRAGDWGQVEACKRSGRIFLTEDRLAALYAFYRKVPFVLIRIHDYQDLGHDMTQYSCCLGRL